MPSTAGTEITPVFPELYHCTLPAPLAGFERFINVWLYQKEAFYLVDVGPATTAAALIDALERLGVPRLDWILLTHIHLDHAGGIGEVRRRFPESRVVCHASAVRHLLDPSRLWEGSLKTLGKLAEAYGPVEPVPEAHLVPVERFADPSVRAVPTPGHAGHHVSYLAENLLFIGEAGGVILPADSESVYMRPATPPRLFLDTFMESLDRLIALNPAQLCCGHFGFHPGAVQLMKTHKRQLRQWARTIREALTRDPQEDLADRCFQVLLEEDPLIQGLSRMPPAARNRECFFMKNSIQGFIGHMKSKAVS
jgi:glyoxylase-like metal-dependent hydrolase (beta-lactamase superfamily II)